MNILFICFILTSFLVAIFIASGSAFACFFCNKIVVDFENEYFIFRKLKLIKMSFKSATLITAKTKGFYENINELCFKLKTGELIKYRGYRTFNKVVSKQKNEEIAKILNKVLNEV